jgi:hypothetical protein
MHSPDALAALGATLHTLDMNDTVNDFAMQLHRSMNLMRSHCERVSFNSLVAISPQLPSQNHA